MTSVLVTGGSGFIGQHLVATLVDRGLQVRVLDIHPPTHPEPEVEYVEGSVLDPDRVGEAVRGVEQVYHLAGLPGMWMRQKSDFHAVNCRGTEVVLAAARKHGTGRFLHCSTESILFRSSASEEAGADYTLPMADHMPGPYTRSKMLAEQRAMQAAASGFPVVIGTPTMPIGLHDHDLTPPVAMLRHFLNRRFQLYLDFIVNLVDVRDVAAGLLLAMERGQVGHRYIFGGESIPLKEVLRLVAENNDRRSFLIPVPAKVAEAAAAMMELIADYVTRKPPSGTAEGVRIARRATSLSIEKAERELGYAPRPVEPALRETIAYLRDAAGDQQRSGRAGVSRVRPAHAGRRYGS
ncbi:MAG TPA: NAD-dependent epimerase/dehydratase family protein [Bradyrhizobium sp.]|nr:NAD-dependent epimerase/dehydratase family protein [Bradyrhizobium sp.]